LEIILPYLQKQQQDWLAGQLAEYPGVQRQAIKTYLLQVKACPEITRLIDLLE
jgi:hypothetical protein